MIFNRDNPCPNCGSGRHIPKGNDLSCWGIGYSKGFLCTRENLPSKRKRKTGYWHWFDRCGCGRDHGTITPVSYKELQQSRNDNRSYAIHVWQESISIDDPACNSRLYLRSRGIINSNPELRYHPGLNHQLGMKKYEVLISRVSDINNKTIAIQRIYLDGPAKADLDPNKMTLGSPIGGAVKLGQVTDGVLGICEGIETGLSVQQLTGIPVWVSLGSTFMDSIILPDTDRLNTIRVYADGDKAGTQAYESLKAKHGSMYNVELHQAPPGKDYNDILMAKKKEQGVSYY